jgi:hypothetical protein
MQLSRRIRDERIDVGGSLTVRHWGAGTDATRITPFTERRLLGKLQNSFPQLPQAPFLFVVRRRMRGDISISR